EAVDVGTSAGDVYRVQQGELDALVRRTLAGAVPLRRSGRTRVQVLNGTGEVGLSQRVTVRLVQAPSRPLVLFTGNASRFDIATTQIVFYDPRQRRAAQEVRNALGVGRLVLSRDRIDVVDVSVVVGRDYRDEG